MPALLTVERWAVLTLWVARRGLQAFDADFFGCQQGHSGAVIADTLKKQDKVLSFNASGKHYYIFEEVDNLSKTAQAGLKTTLNSKRGTFILTTNNISQLDKGVKDRCLLVEINAATDAENLPLARRIASDENVVLNDSQLLAAIAGKNGSFRSVIFSVLRLALRTARQTCPSAASKLCNIKKRVPLACLDNHLLFTII